MPTFYVAIGRGGKGKIKDSFSYVRGTRGRTI